MSDDKYLFEYLDLQSHDVISAPPQIWGFETKQKQVRSGFWIQ